MMVNGRLQFDVLDLFRTAQGIRRDDGYAVIPGDVARRIEDEFERLYAIEDAARKMMDAPEAMVRPQSYGALRELLGL